jgi:phage terminase large subunit GpA-like protein
MVAATAPDHWLDGTSAVLCPPPRLSLSAWADEHFRLSSRTAQPGKWRTRPYQREILDAILDPAVERVTWMKSGRVGYTSCVLAVIAYFMREDPCAIMDMLPTVNNGKKFSREMIAPMLRDVPILAGLVSESTVKTTGNTILDKEFPGGVLSIVGANSGADLRMVSRRVAILDEIDAYPPSAGDEGDPIALAEKRTEDFWNRKIICGSTPLVSGTSRIEELFLAGDQRRRHWPCPSCGHFDFLTFSERNDGRGHVMRWPDGKPHLACFECRGRGCVIEERDKESMDEDGKWRADAAFTGHASFHLWAAYSTSPNARWGQIATRFVKAKKLGPEKLRTVVNTDLAETWQERGEAPDWERLYQRREQYQIGTVPAGAIVLTCGVDVQKDRLVPEVVGWGANKENWSILWEEIHGDTALLTGEGSPWVKLEELLARSFLGADGRVFLISMMAVDGGWQTASTSTQVVYAWGRQQDRSRVMVTKGVPGAGALIEAATPVDVTLGGKRIQRGYRVWPVHVDGAKGELYGQLRLEHVEGDPPPGYCHFPEHPVEYFKQLTAEHLMSVVNRRTHRAKHEWQGLPNRENHALDARVLARVAAARLGIDRLAAATAARSAPTPAPAAPAASPTPAERQSTPPPAPGGDRSRFWNRPRGGGPRGGGWLGRRR